MRKEKVEALDAGADDNVCKLFSMQELMARIRAALRRMHGSSKPVMRLDELAPGLAQ
jgi:DNA-binding response OmpR family regulator